METRNLLEKHAISISGEFEDAANKTTKFRNAQITNKSLIDQEKNAYYISPSNLKKIHLKKLKNNSNALIPHKPKGKNT